MHPGGRVQPRLGGLHGGLRDKESGEVADRLLDLGAAAQDRELQALVDRGVHQLAVLRHDDVEAAAEGAFAGLQRQRRGLLGAERVADQRDAPVVEPVTLSTGEQFVRVCNRSRTLIRISDDDR